MELPYNSFLLYLIWFDLIGFDLYLCTVFNLFLSDWRTTNLTNLTDSVNFFVSLPIGCPSTEQARHFEVLDSPWYIQKDLGKSMIWPMHVLSCSCFLYCCRLNNNKFFCSCFFFGCQPYNNGKSSLFLSGHWPNNNPIKMDYRQGKELNTLSASTLGVGLETRLGTALSSIPGDLLPSKIGLSSLRALYF